MTCVCNAGGPGSPELLHSHLAGAAWCAAGPSPPVCVSPDGVAAQASQRICGCILFSGFSVFEDSCSTVLCWSLLSACTSPMHMCPAPRPGPAPPSTSALRRSSLGKSPHLRPPSPGAGSENSGNPWPSTSSWRRQNRSLAGSGKPGQPQLGCRHSNAAVSDARSAPHVPTQTSERKLAGLCSSVGPPAPAEKRPGRAWQCEKVMSHKSASLLRTEGVPRAVSGPRRQRGAALKGLASRCLSFT